MYQQSQIDASIQLLNTASISHSKSFKSLSILIKTLLKYTSNTNNSNTSYGFIPCCLFVVPIRLCELIKHDSQMILVQKPQNIGERLLVQGYLKAMVKLVAECDQEIKYIVVEGMAKSICLIPAYPYIMKQWLKVLIQLWGSYCQNLQLAFRCYRALSKLLAKCNDKIYIWCLRRLYVKYFTSTRSISYSNYQHINFMCNTYCQLIRYNKQNAYYVIFGYMRSIALEIDKCNKNKKQDKVMGIKKLYSYQILSCFKLVTDVITKVEGEVFGGIVYPLCEMFAAYERLTESQEYIPLKLHLLEYQLTLSQALQIYIPHTLSLLQKLFQSPLFTKHPSQNSHKIQFNIQLSYKLSKKQLQNRLLTNQIFINLINKIYQFVSVVEKVVYGKEILSKLQTILKGNKCCNIQHQSHVKQLLGFIKMDISTLQNMRRQKQLSLTSDKKIRKYQEDIANVNNLSLTNKYGIIKQEEQTLLKNKLIAEQYKDQGNEKQGQESVEQDEDDGEGEGENEQEDISGWEEASEGASELDQKQISENEAENEEKQQIQNISYQGDPQDAEQVLKQWSQQSWQSQNQLNSV